MRTQLLTMLLLFFAFVNGVFAEPARSRHDRANGLRRETRNKVFRGRVRAHWLENGTCFWYRVGTGPDQHRFILVDAETGTRKEAFDHQKLAKALGKATGKKLAAESLPMRAITFENGGKTIRFSVGDSSFEYDARSDTLEKAKPVERENGTTVNVLPAPRTARRQGGETEIVFANKTDERVKLYWVNNVKNPKFYTDIKSGQQHGQPTYSGHVWLVTDQDEKPLGVFEAVDDPGIAVVDGSWHPGQERGRDREGARGHPGANDGKRRPRKTSPDGRWSARIDDHNVVVRDRKSGEAIRLTNNGTETDPYEGTFYWSPDSKKLVVIQERRGERRKVHLIESTPSDQLQPKHHSFTYAKPGDRIDRPRPRLFDLEKRAAIEISEKLFSNPWSITRIEWAPDSSRFTFLYNQRGHQVLRLVAVDGSTGEATAVIDEKSQTFICYSSKLFLRRLDQTDEIIWMSERDGWNHLYLYDGATGKVKNRITKGEWVVRGVERVDTTDRRVWFTAGGIRPGQDPYHVHHCRINFDGSDLVVLTEGDGTHRVDFSPDRRFFVDTYSRVDLPPVTELRRSADGSLVCGLEKADWSKLLKTGWRPPERFVAKGRDGKTDIHGVIYRPTDFDSNKKYPVIEEIYAGPQSSHVPKRFSSYHGAQAMAELGFILVRIDGMGTSHRSKKFHDACWRNLADAGFPDRIAWMKAAAATRPWMDLTRVGIYGGSAGGQNAMRALIAHGDFYQAAAADCGCHDNRMDKIWWNEQWMGWPVGPHYAESSNVEQAHRLQGHLMLLVGEMDRNVDPASTMQVVDALIEADKDFELIVFPGKGHAAGGSEYGTRRQREFFIEHLQNSRP
ncbi:MAG: prolyl oligopeptidase family serine peptidase [Pirellulaceae bacterium]